MLTREFTPSSKLSYLIKYQNRHKRKKENREHNFVVVLYVLLNTSFARTTLAIIIILPVITNDQMEIFNWLKHPKHCNILQVHPRIDSLDSIQGEFWPSWMKLFGPMQDKLTMDQLVL